MEHPAGESDDGFLRVDFDRRLRLEFHGTRITSDAGLLAYRELDDALGLTELAGGVLSDGRGGRSTRHVLTGLFRPSVFGRLAGYEDVNDAERLAHDPTMRAVVGRLPANAVRLQLHALAYILGNFLRTVTLPEEVKLWSMTTLRERLVKIGARIVRHGRSISFQMAEVVVTRGLFQAILSAIAALRPSPARC
jgi:hypothetical protein